MGEYTCVNYNGQSVVDYMLYSRDFDVNFEDFEVLSIVGSSDHFPLRGSFKSVYRRELKYDYKGGVKIEKFK